MASATEHNPPSIEAVLFDYGLVLSGPPDPEAWARMGEITSLSEDDLHAAYWAHRHDYDRGALTGPAYWQAVAANAGASFTEVQIRALLDADTDLWTQPNQPMIDWAAHLQRTRVRTGILSNIGDSIAQGICAKLPWLAGFDHCTWSHALFLAKPDPQIYLKTSEALHTPAARILFLDDREENTDAAEALGMHTLHFTTYPEFVREMIARSLGWLLA